MVQDDVQTHTGDGGKSLKSLIFLWEGGAALVSGATSLATRSEILAFVERRSRYGTKLIGDGYGIGVV